MRLCQVLVEFGITKPKSKFHSSRHLPLKRTWGRDVDQYNACRVVTTFIVTGSRLKVSRENEF